MIEFSKSLRAQVRSLGFAKIAISRPERLDERNGLKSWLEAGHHGDMLWMQRDPEKRLDPRLLFDDCRSVVTLAMNYYSPEKHSENAWEGKISRYAWGMDYHAVAKNRLRKLLEWIRSEEPTATGVAYCDTGPIMDKAWAHKSGLGWIGKHSNLISRDWGSWLFLSELLLNLELDTDSEDRNYCGTCQRCMAACPTQAIVAPYIVDARRCISYLTIELRGSIPREFRRSIGSRIFGCDDCQDVCPWNRFAQITDEGAFRPASGNHTPDLKDLMTITEEEFRSRFAQSPIRRAKYAGFLRNVAVALGNSRDPAVCGVLIKSLNHSEPLVREHVAWALGEIGGKQVYEALLARLQVETSAGVREEIALALGMSSDGPSVKSSYMDPEI